VAQNEQEEEKLRLGLSGELLVAGELLRRNMSASITYGNAKKGNVIAGNGRIAISIEVKTTREGKWTIAYTPKPNDSISVLVNLPRDPTMSAEFFILTGAELHNLKPAHDAFSKGMETTKGPLQQISLLFVRYLTPSAHCARGYFLPEAANEHVA
jgi:hypothetical protein